MEHRSVLAGSGGDRGRPGWGIRIATRRPKHAPGIENETGQGDRGLTCSFCECQGSCPAGHGRVRPGSELALPVSLSNPLNPQDASPSPSSGQCRQSTHFVVDDAAACTTTCTAKLSPGMTIDPQTYTCEWVAESLDRGSGLHGGSRRGPKCNLKDNTLWGDMGIPTSSSLLSAPWTTPFKPMFLLGVLVPARNQLHFTPPRPLSFASTVAVPRPYVCADLASTIQYQTPLA